MAAGHTQAQAQAQSESLVNRMDSSIFNLASLKRIDGDIEEIIETANHVSLYQFQLDTNSWKRKDVEGSLFVVKRSVLPRFQFIILNRLSPKNYIEDILDSFDFERNPPYLMYKNSRHEVLGIWFYDDQDSERVFRLMTKLCSAYNVGQGPAAAPPPERRESSAYADTSSHLKMPASAGGSNKPTHTPSKPPSDAQQQPSVGLGGLQQPQPQRKVPENAKAADGISDLLGMLGPGKPNPARAGDHRQTTQMRKGSASERQDALSQQQQQQVGLLPSLVTPDFFSPQSAGGPPQAEPGFTRGQLKSALERLVQNDAFVDMIYTEIQKK